MRHLTDRGALAALARGVPIEQMLTVALVPDQGTITWLSASPSRRAVTLRVHRVWDDGSDEFCDESSGPSRRTITWAKAVPSVSMPTALALSRQLMTSAPLPTDG